MLILAYLGAVSGSRENANVWSAGIAAWVKLGSRAALVVTLSRSCAGCSQSNSSRFSRGSRSRSHCVLFWLQLRVRELVLGGGNRNWSIKSNERCALFGIAITVDCSHVYVWGKKIWLRGQRGERM